MIENILKSYISQPLYKEERKKNDKALYEKKLLYLEIYRQL